MSKYGSVPKEETLKGLVRDDYFSEFGYEPNIDNIDFVITDKKSRGDLFSEGAAGQVHYLWAEAKKGTYDVFAMFTQLILTCKKTYEKGDHFAPPWLGCFDEARIAFVPFHDILPIFNETDFNWNATPSNHESPDFIKAAEKVKNLIGAKLRIFHFGSDDRDIKDFIKSHFVLGIDHSVHIPITKDNFVQIFIKWVKEVKPFINIGKEEWAEFKQKGILDCDFFRADMMSDGGNTITEKLKIVLRKDNYKFQENIGGRLFTSDIGFTDNGEGYSCFWNKYKRPPVAEYRQYIVDRRDLLVPQNIREVKGSFFTPKIWADKSKEYLSQVFGDTWQDEYYVWDCAAGTGNLLAGLSNEYNVWASDIDQGNVETIQSLIDIDDNLNLLSAHVFQFDFLNDILTKEEYEEKKQFCLEHNLPAPERKIPPGLCDVIDDPEKRKKLIIYINPPYAEATSTKTTAGTGRNKEKVATAHVTRNTYRDSIGSATNEIYAQFIAHIYHKISNCKLALFSKLKFVNSQNFIKFREFFKAEFKSGFIVRSDTFDNVTGKFPIGFTIWDLHSEGFPKSIGLDIVEGHGKKVFWAISEKSINRWIIQFNKTVPTGIAYMANPAPDFQRINQPYVTTQKGGRHFHYYIFNEKNLIPGCIYFAARLCIEQTWLNDRDQFLYPNYGWETDEEFQHNCLIFTLFHGQNRISANDGVNHWIPFTEKEVGAKEKFQSNFMSGFLKTVHRLHELPPIDTNQIRGNPCSSADSFSAEAQAVMGAGHELWRYYHGKIKNNKTVSVNASFYDIREFFQGRKENGVMNAKSADETYNALLKALREALKVLAKKIEPKVYEYGFLRE